MMFYINLNVDSILITQRKQSEHWLKAINDGNTCTQFYIVNDDYLHVHIGALLLRGTKEGKLVALAVFFST